MAAGLRVVNQNDILLIDETHFNYRFVSKHVITFSSGNSSGLWTGGSAASAVLSVPNAESPIVAARSSAGWILAASGKVGTNWIFHFSGGLSLGTAVPGDTIECFVFDRPSTISGPGVGLRVWDSSGLNVYDSRQRYMRVIDFRRFNVGFGVDIMLPGSIAQIVTSNQWVKSLAPTTPSAGNWVIRSGFTKNIAGGFNVTSLNYAEGIYTPTTPPPFVPGSTTTTGVMTVDVSGY